MAYRKTAFEQLLIVRQSSLERAVQLYLSDKGQGLDPPQLAENFVKWIYSKIGVAPGAPITDAQTQGLIVLQNVLTRTTEMAIRGGIEPEEIFTAAEPLLKYIYEGVDAKN